MLDADIWREESLGWHHFVLDTWTRFCHVVSEHRCLRSEYRKGVHPINHMVTCVSFADLIVIALDCAFLSEICKPATQICKKK